MWEYFHIKFSKSCIKNYRYNIISLTKHLNFLADPGVCSVCWIVCQFLCALIAFPAALQWKRWHLLGAKKPKVTESSTALNPARIYFSKLTNTVPGCVAVEPLWMHASVRGNAALMFAVSSFSICTFTFSSLILKLPAHKYSKHRRFIM